MSRLRVLWWRVSGSLWFVPAIMVAGAVLLAVALIELDTLYDLELARRLPRVFGIGAEGAREMLSAIASSMITVAGVVFSITLAVLSLAASQYSPRVLRSFMADRPTQVVLGVFVGAFAYCLVVLRTVRSGAEDFVPTLAVLGALALAFAGIGFLVFLIHHLATSIEASSILLRVAKGTHTALEEPLAWLEGDGAAGEKAQAALNACYSFARQRTIEQDVGFGVQQIVDVGLKALSPGINDQSTAILCIDRLSDILVRLARRRIETPFRRDESTLRVIALGPSFGGLVALAFSDLRENGGGKPVVLARLLRSIERIAEATRNVYRRRLLAAEAERIVECAQRTLAAPYEREQVLARAGRLRRVLMSGTGQ